MSRTSLMLSGLLLCSSACSVVPLGAGPSDSVGTTYVVTGTATVSASQDLADLTIVLTSEALTPKQAAAEVRSLKVSFDEAVDKSGVALDDKAWSSLRLSPIYKPIDSRGIRTRLAGYEATHVVTLTVSDFETLPELMEIGASTGATRIDSSFRVADRPALKAQAREMAAEAARHKAETMTDLLGVSLGRVIGIHEGSGFGGFDNNEANYIPGNRALEIPSVGTHGESEGVTVTVTLTYELG